MLELKLRFRRGPFNLELDTTLDQRVTAFFGPSGCGKTTLLNLIAGLARPESGRILLAGETLFDSEAGIDLPPERRRVGYLFQEGRLFPHLNVSGNLRYGLRRSKDGGALFEEVVEVLELHNLLHRQAQQLSGGEKQRAALGRALLRAPCLLLLDEPLASLDEDLKGRILPFLARTVGHFDLPMIYVSHSSAELRSLADHVKLLENGKIAGEGDPEVLFPGSTPFPKNS
ncbi:molybdenum ABC transporter ATP-binding protein [bacterium]|nr:molybdenum ABC transporter ATP-binding protein [bacterium]